MDKATIEKLAEAPIEFVGCLASPGGQTSIALRASELEVFCEDPEAFYAFRHGVAKDVYRRWVETDGTPRCGAVEESTMQTTYSRAVPSNNIKNRECTRMNKIIGVIRG